MQTSLHFFLFFITLWVSIIIPAVQSQCIKDEQLSLLQFKKSLVFNHSTKLVSWNASTDCCSWVGVTCSRNGRVLVLDISSEQISAGIDSSSSLFQLHFLQSLNLADNQLGASIPTAIGKLLNLRLVVLDLSSDYEYLKLGSPNLHRLVHNFTELRELYLDAVQISEQGNEWCRAISSSLPNLRVLSMSACDLSGPFHESLAKLQSLSVIRLKWNYISAPVPGFFADFSNLTVLDLFGCSLHGTFPKDIFQLPSLLRIDLSTNGQLKGSLPQFPNNGSLQYLDLSGTKFSGLLPNSIGNLKMLSTISIQDCNFNGPVPKSMTNLTQLVYLRMANNKLEGSVPSFSMAKNAINIDISYNGLTGTIDSTHWRNLTKLSRLSLSSNKLDGDVPASLFSLPLLCDLDLSSNQFSGPVPEILNVSSYLLNGPDLELDLSSNNLEGPLPMSIFSLRGLKTLNLSSNNLSGSFPLDDLHQLRNQSNLQTLDLSDTQINGKVPNWIWSFSNLRYLDLSCNSLDSLEFHSINLTNLYYLDLHSNRFHGQIPIFEPPCNVHYLDFSKNYYSSIIPSTIGDVFLNVEFLLLSSNNLNGIIPESLCNPQSLKILDLSNNSLSGTVPRCLSMLVVLNVRRNNLTYVDEFSENCGLETLDISGNQIQGQFLKSLVNCTQLEILNLGNNLITEQFPCFLRKTSTLRVLILRSNKFYGRIACQKTNGTWPVLQIIDLAHNNFSGEVPAGTTLTTWQAMRTRR
ncbi:putative non-specific serine/threonine protein kinase [Rosa chinensis]|uniref:Putative non-specific serine/threonine protein kinase n=1 Tax=Rosa chinensis TaxID=74649 RepID=A0A2P6SQ32_ROSCH|nr:putative non-specific serine/threonine protein kinase [Rosa chinensis]